MLGGAYSTQYKALERQHVDTIKTIAENEKTDSIARAKKLSLETNKRRRALAVKRKAEAEREERRRQQILAKRREKQQEATEKFQRSHIPHSRPGSGTSNSSRGWSPRRGNSTLDDALKLVRGSPSGSRASSAKVRAHQTSPASSTAAYYRQNSDPLSKPYFNKYAHPSINGQTTMSPKDKREDLHHKSMRNLNNSRHLFEQQLETYQQTLLEQQQKSLHDFNKQVMAEIVEDKNVVNGNYNGDIDRRSSVSSVDSLEEEGSTDTLRESCDLDTFMQQRQNGNGNTSGNLQVTKTVTFADKNGEQDSVRTVSNSGTLIPSSGNNVTPQNIDSYNAQIQSLLTPTRTPSDAKQQAYLQRQREIQQQLQEQKQEQQRQQQDLQQKVLDQQRKQHILLQQQFEKQQQEKLEKQQQDMQRQQLAQLKSGMQDYTNDAGKENSRPKVQMKAWGTPSPHPPVTTPVAMTTAQEYVTHASPYSNKNTHTNMTVTTYENPATAPQVAASTKPSVSVIPASSLALSSYNNSNSNVLQNRTLESTRTEVKFSEHQSPPVNVQDKTVSFLETVTNDLTSKTNLLCSATSSVPSSMSSNVTTASMATATSSKVDATGSQSSVTAKPPQPPSSKSAATSSVTPTKVIMTTNTGPSTKPPASPSASHYGNSYGAAFAARQQHLQQTNGLQGRSVQSETPATTTMTNAVKANTGDGTVPWGSQVTHSDHPAVMFTVDNGQDDIADTDSVSTICDESQAEPRAEVRSILKRPPSSKKPSGILKKSGSIGSMKEIRDSLEITRVQLQTSAEEKEQRMLRERERLKNPASTPSKKNVRFADLSYDEPAPQQADGDGDNKLFHRRNEGSDGASQKPPRPVSAVAAKTFNPKIDQKPPRASSATTQRTSTIPRAKTQIVRPQAAAHIITQSTQNIDSTSVNELENKKVTIVNGNFMEKVPAMARANQTALTVEPSSVYAVSSVNYNNPQQQQKGHYAVSSIIMPKSQTAPFLYPGGNQRPEGSTNGPSHTAPGSKYNGAVYDDSGLRLDRTPTDDEINLVWDKLQTCLGKDKVGDMQQTGSRQAAPVANTYIDGNSLGQFNSLNRVAQSNSATAQRQNAMNSANSSYTRRYGLLQQRKQQPNPNSLKSRQQQQGYTVYQAPVPSHMEPQAAPTLQNGGDVSESMAGFLAAEQLAEQSVSESRIHQAIDDAQARQGAYNSARPQPKAKSALSIEEQRLMESLDRLNDKLKVTEDTIPGNGQQTLQQQQQQQQQQQIPVAQQQQQQGQAQRQQHIIHVSGFKGHAPLHAQRRIVEMGNHKARLRITSAALKRNIHRTQ